MILRKDGLKYKIGSHGYVFVYINSEWIRTSALTSEEFNSKVRK